MTGRHEQEKNAFNVWRHRLQTASHTYCLDVRNENIKKKNLNWIFFSENVLRNNFLKYGGIGKPFLQNCLKHDTVFLNKEL